MPSWAEFDAYDHQELTSLLADISPYFSDEVENA